MARGPRAAAHTFVMAHTDDFDDPAFACQRCSGGRRADGAVVLCLLCELSEGTGQAAA